MQDTLFEGARIVATRFEGNTQKYMANTRFGNLERFEAFYVGRRRIDELQQAIDWINETTGQPEDISYPCPTARQIQKLFLKEVIETFQGKNSAS